MTAPQDSEKIESLMKEGLDHYAMGDDARAIACWQQVVALDPAHAEAQDYLRTATDESDPAPPPAPEPEGGGSSLLEAGIELLREGQAAEAVELLETL